MAKIKLQTEDSLGCYAITDRCLCILNLSTEIFQNFFLCMAAYEDEDEDTELDEDGKAKLPCLNCRLIQVLENCCF